MKISTTLRSSLDYYDNNLYYKWEVSLRVTLCYANGETSVLFYSLGKVSDDDRIVVGFSNFGYYIRDGNGLLFVLNSYFTQTHARTHAHTHTQQTHIREIYYLNVWIMSRPIVPIGFFFFFFRLSNCNNWLLSMRTDKFDILKLRTFVKCN